MELNNPMNDHHRILLCRARTKKGLLSLRHPSADEFESLKILIYNPESVIRRRILANLQILPKCGVKTA